MNQPIEERSSKLEQRIEDIEQSFKEVIKNEEQIIKLSQRHRHNAEHLKVIVEGIALDIGDSRERFDTIERTLAKHSERFDTIERTQTEHGDLLRQVLAQLERLV